MKYFESFFASLNIRLSRGKDGDDETMKRVESVLKWQYLQ